MQLNMCGLRLNTLFLYFLFHHLYLYFLFFFFNFPSFYSLYFSFFYSFFFYFLLQPMLILTGLSWCHKFQLHFMSLMPQIKRTFIKIERFKMKPCPSQKKMTRVRGSNITQYFFHTLRCTEFDPCLLRISLFVTGVSPPIFGLQHCCRFPKRMQLKMGRLRLNTLFSTTFSIIFLFTSFLFSSISLPSAVYISSFPILCFSIFSVNVC